MRRVVGSVDGRELDPGLVLAAVGRGHRRQANVLKRSPVATDPVCVSDSTLRLSEVVAARSHALDLTEGQPRGHAVRTCLIGMRIAEGIGLEANSRSALVYALLMKDAGCSSNAARVVALFGTGDHDAKRRMKTVDFPKLTPAMRALAVADVYEAMTADRPYRAALSREEALAIIAPDAGTKLCASRSRRSNGPSARTLPCVRVTVRLFAGLRERAGWATREFDAATGADVWPALDLGAEPDGLLYAVNRSYAARDAALADGDEVALIPPVSGGAFLLSDEPLSLDRVVGEVRSDEAGAIATFTGTTRLSSRGRRVHHLDYEAYEGMAEGVMAEIGDELQARYELTAIAIHHRVGHVEIGGTSVVIAVSAPHRADALAACRDAIDTLKERVPLWKKETYEGGEEWIGRGS